MVNSYKCRESTRKESWCVLNSIVVDGLIRSSVPTTEAKLWLVVLFIVEN